MKSITLFCALCCAIALTLVTGCDQKDKPLKEGVIWSVRWVEFTFPSQQPVNGLYRTDKQNPALPGTYTQDIYGVLYPTFLEVRFVGSPDSHTQIIPWGKSCGSNSVMAV